MFFAVRFRKNRKRRLLLHPSRKVRHGLVLKSQACQQPSYVLSCFDTYTFIYFFGIELIKGSIFTSPSLNMPRKYRKRGGLESDNADESGSKQAVTFVSYHGPHKQTTAADKRMIHKQAMKEIGRSRRRPNLSRFVELDTSLLHSGEESDGSLKPPASCWLGVRWTLADCINMLTSFTLVPDALESKLIANSKQPCTSRHA